MVNKDRSNEQVTQKEKSIVFIGFMGVGKTTVGELVAEKLHRSFIDMDQKIEENYQMPIPEIFKTLGEEKFRQAEKHTIITYSKQRQKVISLGGGAFLQEEIRKACMSECIVIYLDISWEAWKERLDMLIDNRPVLQGRSIEEIKTLFHERKNTYSDHHLKLVTDHLSEEEVANQIIESLK